MQGRVTYKLPVNGMAPSMPVEVANPIKHHTGGSLQWVSASAVWDTGAQNCVISRDLCNKLGLVPRSKAHFAGVGGMIAGNLDIVWISLSRDRETFLIALAGVVDSPPGGYDMLIGMDVIVQGDFSMSCRDGVITISFNPYPGSLKMVRK